MTVSHRVGAVKARTTRLLRVLERPAVFGNLLTAPLNLLLTAMLVVPTVVVAWLALVNWQPIFGGLPNAAFSGIDNFSEVVHDTRFWDALERTLIIGGIALSLELILGFGLALLLSGGVPCTRFFTSVFLFPMMLPWVVVGLAFYLIFLDSGPLTHIVNSLFGPGAAPSWLAQPTWAFVAVIAADVWQWTPFVFLVLYSALLALPREPDEAARTLGASWFQRFRYIVLPGLRNILILVALIRGLELFKIFDTVWIITKGGPGNSTETLSLYLYRTAFEFNRLSYAAAMALIVLAMVSLVAKVAVRPLEYREK
jgi:multiple sugar transport system permease protein